MNQEIDLLEFDDSEAIEFILQNLPSEYKAFVKDDDVQYVLDLIIDYYDSKEYLNDDDEVSEATIAEDDMLNDIWKTVKKEEVADIDVNMLAAILDGEYQYGKKIGIYTEAND